MLSNFNHERWVMICSSARSQRLIVEECLKWTTQRKAFGKPLHSQAVIRSKLAAMISRVESVQHWLESVTYQMNKMVCAGFLIFSSCTADFCFRVTNNKLLSLQGMFKYSGGKDDRFNDHNSPIGLLKMHATRSAQLTATDAVQIFGGRGITRTGMGEHIEHVSF
jgi:alkylation response protein AidB-like acyl-CoA dehydrogenase